MPDRKEVEQFITGLLNLARQMNRFASSVDIEKSYQALLALKNIYVAAGGDWKALEGNPLGLWLELIKYEVYLPPNMRAGLTPFKQLVEYGLSGFMQGFREELSKLLKSVFEENDNPFTPKPPKPK